MVGRFCPCRSWRRQGGDRREKNGTKASKRAGDKSVLFCFGSHVKAPGSVVCAVAPMHITDLLYVTQWCIRAAMGRGGFRLDCFWESTDIGPPEGRPGSGFVFFTILPTTGLVRHRTYAGGTHQSSITWPTLPDTVLPHPFPFRQPHLLYRPLPRGWYGLGGGAAAACGGVQLREGQPPPDSGLWNPGPRTCRYLWKSTSEKSYVSRPKCPAGPGGGKF